MLRTYVLRTYHARNHAMYIHEHPLSHVCILSHPLLHPLSHVHVSLLHQA